MKSLYEIFKESFDSPKAIILAGAPGAGKSYVLNGLDLSNLRILNIDKYFIDLLKKANVSLDLKRGDAESRSKAAYAMRHSHISFKKEQDELIDNRESFILDGTAASFKNTHKLKERLEDIGYDVFMLYVYIDLENSLKRNQERFEKSRGEDRSLLPPMILRTWEKVTKNYGPYKELFGNNFVSVSNILEDGSIRDLQLLIKKYLDPFRVTDAKPKDEKRKIRDKKAWNEMESSLKYLLSDGPTNYIINNSSTKEEAQQQIKQFLS